MNPSTSHNNKETTTQKQHKQTTKRLTDDQVRLLESCFDSNKKLEPGRKHQLSRQLGVPPKQIAIWYQNKRARWKNQSLEHDYTMLQLQLEATLAQTEQLQKEVEQLQLELKNQQAILARGNNSHKQYHNNNNNHQSSMDYSISASGEETRSSYGSLEDVNGLYFPCEQVFELGDTYAVASMMGSDLGYFLP